jgi:hypothetical protein
MATARRVTSRWFARKIIPRNRTHHHEDTETVFVPAQLRAPLKAVPELAAARLWDRRASGGPLAHEA